MVNTPLRPVIARVLVGLVLVMASALKIGGPIPLWFSAVLPFASNVWVLAVLVELLFGLVLISGIGWGRLAFTISLAMFSTLATIAIVLTLRGESSCGCLGRVPLRPWGAAILDLSAIGLLLAAGRGLRRGADTVNREPMAWRVVVTAVLGVVVLVPATALSTKYRDVLVVANPISADRGDPGSWARFSVEIRNRGTERVKIVASQEDDALRAWAELREQRPTFLAT